MPPSSYLVTLQQPNAFEKTTSLTFYYISGGNKM